MTKTFILATSAAALSIGSAIATMEVDEGWVTVNVIPEPSVLLSLLIGVTGLAGWRRIRRVVA